jgi:hypothetical protein
MKSLFHWMVVRMDRALGASSEHLHFIVDASIGAFVDFLFFTRFALHRQALPVDAMHVARILSAASRDCGTCVQTAVNGAQRDGVRAAILTATLERRPEALPPELREIYDFTEHVLQRTYAEDELRGLIRRRHGDRALVDLAFAIASAQVFPLLKQVLGYATTCSKVVVRVDGEPVRHAVAAAA